MMPTTERPLTGHIRPDRSPLDLGEYERLGGYQGLRRALTLSRADIEEELQRSGLRGRGGAGFPTATKWALMPSEAEGRRPRYVVANGDEMEPGTMKDRWLMEGAPHQLIEGAAIAAYAVGAQEAFLFVRWEYRTAVRHLQAAVAQAYEHGFLGENVLGSGFHLHMHVHSSAGRYMCGEEEGMLNALEGRRAVPRTKPPHPQICGLWGKPTLANNVETLSAVPHIIARGGDWFRSLSRCQEGGTKIYGASGRLKRPGLWELPMGTPAREILEEHAGGMQDGRRFVGALPGGASTAFIVDQDLDTPMDFESLQRVGARLGTGTMVVLDDGRCPVGMALNLVRFFARESCGWCTPCREGLPWVAQTLAALESGDGRPEDLEVLAHHVAQIRLGHTFCAMAPGAMAPVEGALRHFSHVFNEHITRGACPWS